MSFLRSIFSRHRAVSIRPVREAIAVTIAGLALSGLCLSVFHSLGTRVLKAELRNSLVQTARTAAAFVDGDLHRTFIDPSQTDSDAYRRAVEPLRRFLHARSDIRFLYTMILGPQSPCIILDATPPGDADKDGVEDHSPIMQPYTNPAPALLSALREGLPTADREPVRDQWGLYFSAYAPFFDSRGRQAGVAGVDMDAHTYVKRLNLMHQALGVGWLAMAALSVLIGVGVGWLRQSELRSTSRRDEALTALRNREAEYRDLLERTPDLILRFDAGYRHAFASASLVSFFGLRPDVVEGKTHRQLGFPPDECAFWEEKIESVLKFGKPLECEQETHTPSGRKIMNMRLFPEVGVAGRVVSVFAIVRDITSHREAERDYRMLFDQMIAGFALHEIICDAQGKAVNYRFLALNAAFERQTGLRADDLIGRTVLEVLPQTEPYWIETYGRVALTGEIVHFENYTQTLDRYYEVTAYRPAPGQFACIILDVSDRKLAQEALQEREERYRLLVDSVTDALFVHAIGADHQSGPFIEVNDEACRRLGYSRGELLGMSFRDIEAPSNVADHDGAMARVLTGESVTFEDVHRAKDGRLIPVEIRARRFSLKGEPAVISIARDISDRRRSEDERRKVQEQLQHVQKLEGLGLLAGGIAHDFNNLLMAILGNVDLALEEVTPESPVTPSLQDIKKISLRAADLCKQMLAYSGKGKFVISHVDLSRLVHELTNLLDVSISKKAVLRYNLAERLPAIAVDTTQVRQVIMNLVINASEAIGERSGVISLTTGVMECDETYLGTAYVSEQAAPGRFVYLEVADSGSGMTEETRARMFDPFFTTKFTGRGLGLAAVLGIMRGHRGMIKVYSELGRGSCLKVLFPASDEAVSSEPQIPEAAQWTGTGTVLLVDDEESIRSVAKRMLERIGFDVLMASNGREALDVFQANASGLACVIMDLTMPHMDGDVAFREMRQINASVPVILSSGYNQQEISDRFVGKGLAGFIQKPYQLAQLTDLLRSVLGSQRS